MTSSFEDARDGYVTLWFSCFEMHVRCLFNDQLVGKSCKGSRREFCFIMSVVHLEGFFSNGFVTFIRKNFLLFMMRISQS